MSLLDVLRKRQKKALAPQAPSSSPTAGELERLAVTGATGRQQAATGPATSSLAGQIAQQQATQAQQQLGTEQALQAAGMAQDIQAQQEQLDLAAQEQALRRGQQQAGITAQTQMEGAQRQAQAEMSRTARSAQERQYLTNLTNQYANQLADLASQRGIVEQDLFSDFKQNVAQLSDAKAAAGLEQLSHALALSDRQYVDQLNRLGAERNLMDEIAFKREANELVFQNNLDILSDRLDKQRILNMDAREFKKEMAQMDINEAIRIAEQAAKAQATANILKGGIGVATSLSSYYAGQGSSPTSTSSPTTTEWSAGQSQQDIYGNQKGLIEEFEGGSSQQSINSNWWKTP